MEAVLDQTTVATTDVVTYRREGPIVYVGLNRPNKLNAMNDALIVQLRSALVRLDEDADAFVAILYGEGRSFCSGGDVVERQLMPKEEMRRQGGPEGRGAESDIVLLRFVNYKPVIAAVHGYAIGGGLDLLLQCDLAVASEDTKFQITEVVRGLEGCFEWLRMTARGAGTFADEVALTGRFWSAEEALAHGVINRVVPQGKHIAAAEELAEAMLRIPPLAVRAIVEAKRLRLEETLLEARRYASMSKLYLTDDFRESASAFAEKRQPRFSGH
jgi:enoyl-CoA hydratase/carnithine racemase